MKKFAIFFVYSLLILGLASNASANSIQITSSSYQIWGDWTECWVPYTDTSTTYSNSGSFNTSSTDVTQLSIGISSSPFGWNRTISWIDSFELGIESYSIPLPYHVPHFDTEIIAIHNTHINTFANAVWRFRSDNTLLHVTLSGEYSFNYGRWEQDLDVILNDITSSNNLLLFSAQDTCYGLYFNEYYEINIDPSHEYELIINGWAGAWDAKIIDMFAKAQIVATPEPMVIFLLIFALSWLIAMRNLFDSRIG